MYRMLNDLKKYDLSAFLGNEQIKERLVRWLDMGRLPHSLLITGPDGCGRGMLARTIAAAWLDDTGGLVDRDQHPDCLTVKGEGASGLVSIKQVREVLYELHKSPVMTSANRVCLLIDASRLAAATANALLKALEEPPDGTVFLLCSRHADNLIETIRSRSVVLAVGPLQEAECLRAAGALYPGYDAGRLADLCRTYGGRFGLVRKALDVPGRLDIYDHARRFTNAALRGDKLDMMAALDPWATLKTRNDLKQLLLDSSMMLTQVNHANPSHRATHLYDLLIQADSRIDQYINPKILAAWLAVGIVA